ATTQRRPPAPQQTLDVGVAPRRVDHGERDALAGRGGSDQLPVADVRADEHAVPAAGAIVVQIPLLDVFEPTVEVVAADRLEVRVLGEDGAGVAPDGAEQRLALPFAQARKGEAQIAPNLPALGQMRTDPPEQAPAEGRGDLRSESLAQRPEQPQEGRLRAPARPLQQRHAADAPTPRTAQERGGPGGMLGREPAAG